jgi:hypothetical protein
MPEEHWDTAMEWLAKVFAGLATLGIDLLIGLPLAAALIAALFVYPTTYATRAA